MTVLLRFQSMAAEHERWVVETFAGLGTRDMGGSGALAAQSAGKRPRPH